MYDLNHSRTVPLTPNCVRSLSIRIPWSMVLTVADTGRSKTTKITFFPSWIVRRMSVWTLNRAVSVLWNGWYAACSPGRRRCSMRWRLVWEAATHSRSLDTNARLVIGLKFTRSSLSDKAFLNLDRRRPSLSALGKTPSRNDVFIIVVITGRSSSIQAFSVRIGIGSLWHYLDGDFSMILCTAAAETCWNSNGVVVLGEEVTVRGLWAGQLAMWFRNFLILSTKCPLKHFSKFLNRGVTRTIRDRINFEHAINDSK